MLCQVVLGTFVVLERRHVGLIFSRDTQVIQETGKLMPLVAWCMLGDGMNASVAGSLRGIGKQEVGALLNLVSYWGLGMPLAYVLAFKFDMGLQGLWVGLSMCAMINGVAMFLVLRKWIDWQACIENASHRLRHD